MNLVLILSFAALVITISSAPPENHSRVLLYPKFVRPVLQNGSAPRSYDIFRVIFDYLRAGFGLLMGKDRNSRGKSQKSSKSRYSYKHYQVYRINPKNQNEVEDLKGMSDDSDEIKFWTLPAKGLETDILISPDSKEDVDEILREKSIDYQVIIPDVQKVIAYENPKMTKEQRDFLIGRKGHPMTWARYHRYNDMLRYAEFLVYTYPNLVQLLTIGYSSRGLPLKVVKISNDSSRGDLEPEETKPAVWIDGGMNGREWVTSAVVMYTVRQLVENYEKNKKLVDSADWYLMPVANPDGYEYSHTTDRLWTKTRSDHGNSAADIAHDLFYGSCEGVNMDFNFDYHWGEPGSSDNPCSDFYAGPRAYSEPETRAIADFLLDKRDDLQVYLSLHSYSQQWVLPWSFRKKGGDHDEMVNMAKKAVDALAKVRGTKYKVAATRDVRPHVPGSSEDWAKGVVGVKYSYRVDLGDLATGYFLPATSIIPKAKETYAAIRAITKSILCKS